MTAGGLGQEDTESQFLTFLLEKVSRFLPLRSNNNQILW